MNENGSCNSRLFINKKHVIEKLILKNELKLVDLDAKMCERIAVLSSYRGKLTNLFLQFRIFFVKCFLYIECVEAKNDVTIDFVNTLKLKENLCRTTSFYEIKQILERPMSAYSDFKIPLPGSTFLNFEKKIGSELFNSNFELNEKDCIHGSIETLFTTALNMPFEFSDRSEYSNSSKYDLVFAQVLECLNLLDHSTLFISRGTKEIIHNSTINGTLPDITGSMDNVLLLWGEEKISSIEQADDAIQNKICKMSDEFFANVPFLFAYSAFRNYLRLYAIDRKPKPPKHFVREFDLNLVDERVRLVLTTINLYRVLNKYKAIIRDYGQVFSRASFARFQAYRRPNSHITLTFHTHFLIKTISRMSEYKPARIVDLEAIYEVLIRKKREATNIIKCIRYDKDYELDLFSVTLEPICTPHAIKSTFELVKCLRHLTSGLAFLHRNSILHRDLRWSNILYNKCTSMYMINDFEHGAYLQKNEDSTKILVDSHSSVPVTSMRPTLEPDEVTTRYLYNMSTEMFSFGTMISNAIRESVFSQSLRIFIEDRHAHVDVFEKIQAIANELLNPDENLRPTAENLRNM
jgi:hypothetical protein